MTTNETSLGGWVEQLLVTHPPKSVVVVGAGTGNGAWVSPLRKQPELQVVLAEAQLDKIIVLRQLAKDLANWQCCHAFITADKESAYYHEASIAAESGLLPPSQLQDVWPNILEIKREMRPATTIAKLLEDLNVQADWLLIDCLPALSILGTSTDSMTDLNVIGVRVLVREDEEEMHTYASLAHVKGLLESAGFEMIACEPERNPMIGHALFKRCESSNYHDQMDATLALQVDACPLLSRLLSEARGANIGRTPPRISADITSALSSDHIPDAVSSTLKNVEYNPSECYHYLIGVARHAFKSGDQAYAFKLISEASHLLKKLGANFKWHLIKTSITYGLITNVSDVIISYLGQKFLQMQAQNNIEELTQEKAQSEKATAQLLAELQSLQKNNSELSAVKQLMEEEIRKTQTQIKQLEKFLVPEIKK